MTRKKQKTLKLSGFIEKLVDLLKDEQNDGIVECSIEDRTFTIKNIRRFTEEILPKYFKHRNFSSFVRQVNLYGFSKLKQEEKQESYFHEFFNMESSKDLRKIRRKPHHSDKASKLEAQMHEGSDEQQGEDSEGIEQLTQKRDELRRLLRKEQDTNEKLQYQNKKLKEKYNNENRMFYVETLNLVENILISQVNQSSISQEMYTETLSFLYEQRDLLFYEDEDVQKSNEDKSVSSWNNVRNIGQPSSSRSKSKGEGSRSSIKARSSDKEKKVEDLEFWEELKEILTSKDTLDAKELVQNIYNYAKNHRSFQKGANPINSIEKGRQLDNLALVKNYEVNSKYMPEKEKVIVEEMPVYAKAKKKSSSESHRIRSSSYQPSPESGSEYDDQEYRDGAEEISQEQ